MAMMATGRTGGASDDDNIVVDHDSNNDSTDLTHWRRHLNDDIDDIRLFDAVSFTLASRCGAIPLASFLANEYDKVDLDYHSMSFTSRLYRQESGPSMTPTSVADGSFLPTLAPMPGNNSTFGPTPDDPHDTFSSTMESKTGAGKGAGNILQPGVDQPSGTNVSPSLSASAPLPSLSFSSSASSETPNKIVLPSGDSELPEQGSERKQEAPHKDALDILYETCLRLTGTHEALDFEVVEENPQSFACILAVKSLKGTTRTYHTGGGFSKRIEARREVAKIALDFGVLDFMRTGDPDVQRHKKEELVLRAAANMNLRTAEVEAERRKFFNSEPALKQIEECCASWTEVSLKRGGRKLRPAWFMYKQMGKENQKDREKDDEWGAALRIAFSPYKPTIYSTDAVHGSKEEARAACAKLAVENGVLDLITNTAPTITTVPGSSINSNRASSPADHLPQRLSLQEYYDTLPKPFPGDETGQKSVTDLQPVSRVNSLIQFARIPQLKIAYYVVTSEGHSGAGGLAGCVLRLTHPSYSPKTYIVDPHFAKRQDAKAAVCLLAMSKYVEKYVEEIRTFLERRLGIGKQERVIGERLVLPFVRRLSKAKLSGSSVLYGGGRRLFFDYAVGEKGHGCTLNVDLNPQKDAPTAFSGPYGASNATLNGTRYTTSVPPEYLTKLDAVVAVVCKAAREGAVEFLRFGDPIKGTATDSSTTARTSKRTFWDIVTDEGMTLEQREELIEDVYGWRKGKGKGKGSGWPVGSENQREVFMGTGAGMGEKRKRDEEGDDGEEQGEIVEDGSTGDLSEKGDGVVQATSSTATSTSSRGKMKTRGHGRSNYHFKRQRSGPGPDSAMYQPNRYSRPHPNPHPYPYRYPSPHSYPPHPGYPPNDQYPLAYATQHPSGYSHSHSSPRSHSPTNDHSNYRERDYPEYDDLDYDYDNDYNNSDYLDYDGGDPDSSTDYTDVRTRAHDDYSIQEALPRARPPPEYTFTSHPNYSRSNPRYGYGQDGRDGGRNG